MLLKSLLKGMSEKIAEKTGYFLAVLFASVVTLLLSRYTQILHVVRNNGTLSALAISSILLFGLSVLLSLLIFRFYKRSRIEKERRLFLLKKLKEKEENNLILFNGFFWDKKGNPFCPACKTPIRKFILIHTIPGSYCYKCKQELHYTASRTPTADIQAELLKMK